MGESIFKNFDAENFDEVFYRATDKRPSILLSSNAYLSILCCAKLQKTEENTNDFEGKLITGSEHFTLLTNEEFFILEQDIYLLAKNALASGENSCDLDELADLEDMQRTITICEEALYGHRLLINTSLSLRQIFGWASLKLIDDGIKNVEIYGINTWFCDALLLSVHYMQRAREEMTAPTRKAIDRAVSEAQSQRARDNANIGHANSEKGIARVLIEDFWSEWQLKPHMYSGKEEFARLMQEKHPVITNTTTITRWCTGWQKEKQRSPLAN